MAVTMAQTKSPPSSKRERQHSYLLKHESVFETSGGKLLLPTCTLEFQSTDPSKVLVKMGNQVKILVRIEKEKCLDPQINVNEAATEKDQNLDALDFFWREYAMIRNIPL
jgi:hypothetical protein